MIKEIQDWLDSGSPYDYGVSLYERFGPSASLKRVLRIGGLNSRNEKALYYELKKLSKSTAPELRTKRIPLPVQKPQFVSPIIETPHRQNTLEVTKFKDLLIFRLKERDRLHYMLSEKMSEPARLNYALSILELSDEITDMYLQLDKFNKDGTSPKPPVQSEPKAEKEFSKMDQAALYRAQMVTRTYVSRYKRLLDKATDPALISKYDKKLSRFRTELSSIELLIIK